MARRAKEQGDILSLFPFLSILTCLIGTLTMLIALLAMQQVNKTEVDAAKIKASEQERISAETRLRDYKALKDKLQKDKLSISAVKKLLKELEEKRKTLLEEMERLLKEKALRMDEIAKRSKAATKAEELMGELNRFKDKITKVTVEIDRVKKEIAEKTAVLATKSKKSVSSVMVRPSGSTTGLKPTFVECAKDAVVIYDPEGTKRIPSSVLKTDQTFNGLLATVKANEQTTIIFLVRSEGIWTFRNASVQADAVGTRYGKLPIVGDGVLDLSLFGVKRKDEAK
jgi:myosin heavy subunit